MDRAGPQLRKDLQNDIKSTCLCWLYHCCCYCCCLVFILPRFELILFYFFIIFFFSIWCPISGASPTIAPFSHYLFIFIFRWLSSVELLLLFILLKRSTIRFPFSLSITTFTITSPRDVFRHLSACPSVEWIANNQSGLRRKKLGEKIPLHFGEANAKTNGQHTLPTDVFSVFHTLPVERDQLA